MWITQIEPYNSKATIRIISEGSCDTEECLLKKSALPWQE